MGHHLFAGSLVPAGGRAKAAVPVSMAVHVLAVGGLLALPLIARSDPPAPRTVPGPVVLTLPSVPVVVVSPPVVRPRAAPPPPATRHAPIAPVATAPATTPVPLVEPSTLPAADDGSHACVGCTLSTSADPRDGPSDPDAGGGGTGSGGSGNTPLIVGVHVRPPVKLRHVAPVYPDLALRAGIQGTIEIECVIGADGNVASVRVLRSIPLLDAAVLTAVRQWRYRPTLVNGVAVPVLMTVTAHFHTR